MWCNVTLGINNNLTVELNSSEPLQEATLTYIRGYFRLKLNLTSGRCPWWLIFFKNLFYQQNCKEAINIGGGQIRGTLFHFFVVKKCPFLHLMYAALSFYNNPCVSLMFDSCSAQSGLNIKNSIKNSIWWFVFCALHEYFPIRHQVRMFIVLEKRYKYKYWANYRLIEVLMFDFERITDPPLFASPPTFSHILLCVSGLLCVSSICEVFNILKISFSSVLSGVFF